MKRLILLLALLVALGAAGCGGGDDEGATPETVEGTVETENGGAAGGGDPEAGKSVFASAGCGGCHTFQAAAATGTTAPSLDQSSVTEEQAVQQVTNGGGGMPPFGDRLSEQEIRDVAAFVVQERSG